MRLSTEERFWSRVDKTPDCWNWQGALTPDGYGYLSANGKTVRAHRWSYAMANGAVPDGLVLDHLCRNRACVRPDHLEAVTNAENVRRGQPGVHMREKSAQQTECKNGHPWTAETTTFWGNGKDTTVRICKICIAKKDATKVACPGCGESLTKKYIPRHRALGKCSESLAGGELDE